MYLSQIYEGKIYWAWVYHTQPGSAEVEFITEKFFNSKKDGFRWFDKKHKAKDFIEPELIPIILGKMKIVTGIESGKP